MALLDWIPLAGDLLGGLFGESAQKSANRANIKLNRENRDWQEKMSNTAWQRGVEDMKAAGMNPMLAFSQGGASTPNNTATTVIPEDAAARGVSSAAGKAMLALQAEQMRANIGLTEANTEKAKAEAVTAGVTSGNAAERQHWEIQEIRKGIEKKVEELSLTHEQRIQVQKMLPLLIRAAEMDIKATEQSTSSARTKERLDEYEIPSRRAEAAVWEQLGAAGRGANIGANALQQLITIIRSIMR